MDPEKIERLRASLRRDAEVGIHGIKDSDAVRLYDEKDDLNGYTDIRPSFFRDVDRIVHSKAYSRYIDKTQVFFDVNNANITHRSLHVLLVSRLSRQIGRVLKLNTDLIEAISLGHDIGHAPYGHLGEEILNEICIRQGAGAYMHNAQGVRWLSYLERRFPKEPASGLNLTLHVLDGILCHDGEINERHLKPIEVNGKSWDDHFKEYKDCFESNKIKRVPMTFEGIAVRFADTISYIGRDIEDAILLKLISRDQIPKNCVKMLGDTNRKIINSLVMDLINYSLDHDVIGYSKPIYEALKELKKFNYDNIYLIRDDSMNTITKERFELIFDISLKDLKDQNINAPIFKDHVEYIDDPDLGTYFEPHRKANTLSIVVRDYIAGMSDKYFAEIYTRLKNRI
ncbi:MAG: HD domain-containing protein [Candidatus Lokiarchaeota archaeon]|nr:HD domain-containing protein [Candidatus Lokiarchaeota archaeon]